MNGITLKDEVRKILETKNIKMQDNAIYDKYFYNSKSRVEEDMNIENVPEYDLIIAIANYIICLIFSQSKMEYAEIKTKYAKATLDYSNLNINDDVLGETM